MAQVTKHFAGVGLRHCPLSELSSRARSVGCACVPRTKGFPRGAGTGVVSHPYIKPAGKVTAGVESKALLTAGPGRGVPGGLSALLPTCRAGCSLRLNFLAFSWVIFVSKLSPLKL